MQNYTDYVITSRKKTTFATNVVLRNTYFLLSLTLLFSGLTATLAMTYNVAYPGVIVTLLGMFGLLFLVQRLRNSKWGILAAFAFTGFMGYILAPTLNFYLHSFTNGGALIMTSLMGTGVIFLALSCYVLIARKSFEFLGGFLFVAIAGAFVLSLCALLFSLPMLQILISAVFILISSGLILFHTSQIVSGGETNYISATISIYVALFNLFISLLTILGFFAGNRD